jgi:hypothetical protein
VVETCNVLLRIVTFYRYYLHGALFALRTHFDGARVFGDGRCFGKEAIGDRRTRIPIDRVFESWFSCQCLSFRANVFAAYEKWIL